MAGCPYCGDNTWTEGKGCAHGCDTVAELRSELRAKSRRVEALEARIAKADALAAWAKAISERKASPVTGGGLILERDIVGLETALAAYREGFDT